MPREEKGLKIRSIFIEFWNKIIYSWGILLNKLWIWNIPTRKKYYSKEKQNIADTDYENSRLSKVCRRKSFKSANFFLELLRFLIIHQNFYSLEFLSNTWTWFEFRVYIILLLFKSYKKVMKAHKIIHLFTGVKDFLYLYSCKC